jgi:hypothetical protein
MHELKNRTGEVIAILLSNVLLDSQTRQMIAVVLGDVLFGNSNKPCGKIIGNKLHDMNGNIVATISDPAIPKGISQTETAQYADEMWQRISKIESHLIGWIPANNTWSQQSLFSLLN